MLALPGLGGEYVFTLPTFTVVSDQVTFVTVLFVLFSAITQTSYRHHQRLSLTTKKNPREDGGKGGGRAGQVMESERDCVLRTGYLEGTGYLRGRGYWAPGNGVQGTRRTKNLGESRESSFLSFSLEKGVPVKNLARD